MNPANDTIPAPIRTCEKMGFKLDSIGDTQATGLCPFCGKNKLFINIHTGMWDCKSPKCVGAAGGTVYTWMELWINKCRERAERDKTIDARWKLLSKDRGLDTELMKQCGVFLDYSQTGSSAVWGIPVLDSKNRPMNIRYFQIQAENIKSPLRGLPSVPASLYGLETLKPGLPVYLCEGEWDAMAIRQCLRKTKQKATVLATPGAGVFKPTWKMFFQDRDVMGCYDNDVSGQIGMVKRIEALENVAKSFMFVQWPEDFPDKFDVRDFVKAGGTLKQLQAMMVSAASLEEKERKEKKRTASPPPRGAKIGNVPHISKRRVSFDDTVDKYAKWIKFSQPMRDVLRCIFAVIFSNQLDGDPLWMYIVAPPGYGKSELLMSTEKCPGVVARSSVTAASLVSGWSTGKTDPSLIPHLIGNTFILKDFTEILQSNRTEKDAIYGILRGAFDGEVRRQFGGPAGLRSYKGYFSMLAGTTHAIFAERRSIMGERFLVIKMPAVNWEEAKKIINAAMNNVGMEHGMREGMSDAAKEFMSFKASRRDVPEIPPEMDVKIAAVAQLVGMLRADVEKDYMRDVLRYRPQYEVGTRLSKQLRKLLMGLSLTHNPPAITDDDYRIVQQVAMDTCIEWNLDVLHTLAKEDGRNLQELTQETKMPANTLRYQLDNLMMLGVVERMEYKTGERGRPGYRYWISQTARIAWETSGLPIRALAGQESTKHPGGPDASILPDGEVLDPRVDPNTVRGSIPSEIKSQERKSRRSRKDRSGKMIARKIYAYKELVDNEYPEGGRPGRMHQPSLLERKKRSDKD